MSLMGQTRRLDGRPATSGLLPSTDIKRPARLVRFGRVEDGRGNLGHSATPRFPSPLIKPDEPISGIRLSDWLHRKAHGDKLTARGFGTVSNSPSPLDTAISGGACH